MGYLCNSTLNNLVNTPQEMKFTENGFPIIQRTDKKIELSESLISTGFNEKNSKHINPENTMLNFYLEDYMFETCWNQPKLHLNKLKQFKFVCSPDFSLYLDMPKPMQVWNHYRKQWLGAYWQLNEIEVIPTIGWSDGDSFDFCFDGIPKNSVVTVSAKGCFMDKEARKLFVKGYNKMLEVLEPSQIILFNGKRIPELDGNIVYAVKGEKPFQYVMSI